MAHLITTLILVPLLGALFVATSRQNAARGIALFFNLLTATIVLRLMA